MSEATKKQKKLNTFWFLWNLIESIVLLTGGVLAIVFGVMNNNNSSSSMDIENVVAYLVASFVILDGVLRVVMFLARYNRGDEQSPMIISGFEVALGTLLILIQLRYSADHIFTYTVVNLVAIILIAIGLLLLVYAIFLIAKKYAKLFMPIVEILFSAVLVGVGVVIEVLYHTESSREQLVLILSGAILSLAAIGMFIITLITRAKAKKELKKAEEEEQGNYEVAGEGITDNTENAPEIIDADLNEPESVEGPRAIGHDE